MTTSGFLRGAHLVWLALFALALVTVTALFVPLFVRAARNQLRACHDLALETPTIVSIRLIRDGENPYSADVYAAPPFQMTNYPPAYFLALSALPENPENPFTVARIASAGFMIGSAVLLFAAASSWSARAIAWLAVVFFLSVAPVITNTFLARHDSMALFFSVAAVVLIARAASPLSIVLAALFSTVAIFTKQSYVAAPVAIFAFFLATGCRRYAFLFAGSFVTAMSLAVPYAIYAWGSGFVFNLVDVPAMDLDRESHFALWSTILDQTSYRVFVVLLLIGVITAVRARWKTARWRPSLFELYAALAFATLLLTMGKRGASTNYFFEFTAAGLLALISLVSQGTWRQSLRPAVLACALVAAMAWLHDAFTLPPDLFQFTDEVRNDVRARFHDQLSEEIHRTQRSANRDKPDTETQVLFFPNVENPSLALGMPVIVSDAYLYALLWRLQKIPEEPFFAAIRSRRYDVIALPRDAQALTVYGTVTSEFYDRFDQALRTYYQPVGSGLFEYYAPLQGEPEVR